jgi:hypothetical protein
MKFDHTGYSVIPPPCEGTRGSRPHYRHPITPSCRLPLRPRSNSRPTRLRLPFYPTASGMFFQRAKLSAMIVVDCMAAWLMVAYSTISRCTRSPLVCNLSRNV